MPRFDKIISACSFSSGSTRAATFELLIAMLTPPFFALTIAFCISDCKTVCLNTESSSWIMPLILSATVCASSSSFRALYYLYIYSDDLKHLLTKHDVTWSRKDSFCADQYVDQPEEFPTTSVKVTMTQKTPAYNSAFDRFNFDKEVKHHA